MPAADEDFEAWVARFTEGLETGEIEVPAPRAQGMWFEVAGTGDLAALGPEAFAQSGPLDAAAPDGLLAAQVTALAQDSAALEAMSDDALLGLVGASRRLAGRAAAAQQRAIAEFARRHTPATGSRASRHGFTEFCADEVAWQLVVNHNQAETAMLAAANAQRRLPQVCGLLWDGTISEYQMRIITGGTECLSDEGAAEADAILASSVADQTPGQTRALVARVVLMIDPEAAKERKKDAAQRARVERWQEHSGTAALAGRDLPPDAVLAGWQHIDAQAKMLRAAGFKEDLQRLRAAVYLALMTGRAPADMLTALKTAAGDAIPVASPESASTDSGPDDEWPWDEPDEAENGEQGKDGTGNGGSRRGPRNPQQPQGPAGGQAARTEDGTGASRRGSEGTGAAPFAAVINLLVPVGTLFEQGTAPGEIPGYGPLDPEATRDLVQAASAHPATRWCITTIGQDGTAKEHGCVPGQHRWTPPAAGRDPNQRRSGGGSRDGPGQPPEPKPGPGADEEHQLAAARFIARLRVELAPIAAAGQNCDHTHCTDSYQVPRRLKHLVRARKATCVAPGCNRPAADGDADHTVPCRGHRARRARRTWEHPVDITIVRNRPSTGTSNKRAPESSSGTAHPAEPGPQPQRPT